MMTLSDALITCPFLTATRPQPPQDIHPPVGSTGRHYSRLRMRLEPDARPHEAARRPVVVGVTLRPDVVEGRPARQSQNTAYFAALESAGAVPLALPNLGEPDRLATLLGACDALVLPGGPDVDPARYGAERCEGCGVKVEVGLDRTETAVLAQALEAGLPILAICRGIQLLNVAYGGTLWQDLEVEARERFGQHPRSEGRTELVHNVSLEADSTLTRLVGPRPIATNSLHHQGIRHLAPGLRAVGRTDDGLVEAVEDPERPFVVGLQCHPEELVGSQEWADRLFAGLVSAAAAHLAARRLREAALLGT